MAKTVYLSMQNKHFMAVGIGVSVSFPRHQALVSHLI